MQVPMQVPDHFNKFVELYEADSIPDEDLSYKEAGDPADDTFEIALDSYNFLGDKIGKHRFALSIRTLLEQREKFSNQLADAQAEFDEFCDKYDRIIAALQGIKNAKKSLEGPLTSPKK